MIGPAGYPPSGEPAPPSGPGVIPPFVAPPTDRDNRRLWLGLGAGAVAVLVCCVATVVGFGIVVAGGAERVKRESQRTVTDYLGNVKAGKYGAAYRLLCGDLRRTETLAAFVSREGGLVDFHVGKATVDQSDVSVPAQVQYRDQGWRTRTYLVQAEGEKMVICGER
jgi:hypothetical protein